MKGSPVKPQMPIGGKSGGQQQGVKMPKHKPVMPQRPIPQKKPMMGKPIGGANFSTNANPEMQKMHDAFRMQGMNRLQGKVR